jgi:hypothetical protein
MKKILLHSATSRNDGSYVDAGATLTVGDAADQIEAERASDMVDRGCAEVEVAPVPVPAVKARNEA